jgi:hypothetical protein
VLVATGFVDVADCRRPGQTSSQQRHVPELRRTGVGAEQERRHAHDSETRLRVNLLHGILDTITAGGGGFECDVFRLQRSAGCSFEVTNTQQPITFGQNGGSGSFEISAATGCKWDADEDAVAEDFVKVAGGVVNGSGTKTFTVFSTTQAPQPPLPRSGYIQIFDVNDPSGFAARVLIKQA